MKILGMGMPELFMFAWVLVIALFFLIAYLTVKKAVKKAIIEAHDEIEARGRKG